MTDNTMPPGFVLRCILRGHQYEIYRIAWSPDGRALASSSYDSNICLWDVPTDLGGNSVTISPIRILRGPTGTVSSIAWSPDGRALAAMPTGHFVHLWEVATGKLLHKLTMHESETYLYHDQVGNLAWSPDGRLLASSSGGTAISLWDVKTGLLQRKLSDRKVQMAIRSMAWSLDGNTLASGTSKTIALWSIKESTLIGALVGHAKEVYSIAWSPHGHTLASSSADCTIRLWDAATRRLVRVLEGHTGPVGCVAFSADGHFLASKSQDSTVRLWRCDTWETVATLEEAILTYWPTDLAFHPAAPLLATLGKGEIVRIWKLDPAVLLRVPTVNAIRHTSAKVVLVGESNVGKSCLAMRLAEDRYEEQGTTHGMRFWSLAPDKLTSAATALPEERRDVVLWDLGGQDEYRLVHQLFLHDTTVALVLLDPTRGRTGFEEVVGWNLRLEKQLRGRPAVKLLVGTKLDESSTVVDRATVGRLVHECGFAGYYETSAKTGRGLPELRTALAAVMDWENLAKTSRPVLFQRIRDAIELQRAAGRVTLLFTDLQQQIQL